ncbi:LCR-like protein, partial [Trifolium medium]|nr:LCR-like protein [Trifolium medium]
RAGISVKHEAPVNFLTDSQEGRSTLRATDVLVYGFGWSFPTCGIGGRGLKVGIGQAALQGPMA